MGGQARDAGGSGTRGNEYQARNSTGKIGPPGRSDAAIRVVICTSAQGGHSGRDKGRALRYPGATGLWCRGSDITGLARLAGGNLWAGSARSHALPDASSYGQSVIESHTAALWTFGRISVLDEYDLVATRSKALPHQHAPAELGHPLDSPLHLLLIGVLNRPGISPLDVGSPQTSSQSSSDWPLKAGQPTILPYA